MDGSDRRADPKRLCGEPWLEQQLFIESEMALFLECRLTCVQNMLDTADIVREAINEMVRRRVR